MRSVFCECTIRFKIFLASINEDVKIKNELLNQVECILDDSNIAERYLLKNIYWDIKKYNEAIRVSRPLYKYKEFLIGIIKMVLSGERKEFYLELIKEIDKYNDIQLLKYKRYMLSAINELPEAKQVAEEIYKLEENTENLQELINLKLEIMDSNKLEDLLLKLIPSSKPIDYMIVSYGYALLGDIGKFKSYSYESLFMTEGTFEKKIFGNFVGMNFKLVCSGKNEVREFEKVKEDSVVVLKNDNIRINICLNGEKKYQSDKESFECVHIKKNSSLWIELIGQTIGDNINYNDQEFVIDSIVDKLIFIHQYCLSELIKSGEEWGMKQVNIDDLPEVMKVVNESDEEAFKERFKMYNFKDNGMGLPFSKVFYGDDIKKSIELLNIMILNNQYSFYIGTLANVIAKGGVVVLSYQTLLLLEHYNLLDILLGDPNSYYVSYDLKQMIVNSTIEIKNNRKQFYIHYDSKTNNVYKDERDNTIILNKLKNIIEILNKINIKEVNYKVRDNLINASRSFVSESDIDNIYLAKELDCNLIIDDLFIRKLIDSNEDTKQINHTNISYFLKMLYRDNPSKYYNTIKQMVSDKVKYVLDKDDFKNIILNYKNEGYDIEWFKELTENMVSDEDVCYREVILTACREFDKLNDYKYIMVEILVVVEKLNLILN